MFIKKFFPLLFLALPCSASATILVNFDGTEIASDANTGRTDTGSGVLLRYEFSTTDAFFNTGNNQLDFFGGYQKQYLNDVPPEDFATIPPGGVFRLRAADDEFQSSAVGGFPNTKVADGLFLWQQSQFLNGGDVNPVSFDSSSTLSVSINGTNAGTTYRFVIRDSGNYYLSEAAETTSTTFTLTDFDNNSAADKQWGLFTPTATDFGIPTVLPAFSAVDFENVEAVGLIFNTTNTGGRNFQMTDFDVNGVVIPEPNTAVLIGVAGFFGLLRFRRGRERRL